MTSRTFLTTSSCIGNTTVRQFLFEPKLQAGVLIGLGVACADFSTPNMMAISSPITNVMAARGVRMVNFAELRKPGTAIFMIVPEGDAERYKRILSTFFGIANDCLRNGEVKYKQAVAIISNAPPVRLTFPKFARLEKPPVSSREIKFKQVMAEVAVVLRSDAENDSLASSIVVQTTESSMPPESNVDQWSQASESNAAEAEYDLAEMDEYQSPLFDDGGTTRAYF